MKKTIDLKAVREARENLARIASEHPELLDHETPREELTKQWEATLGGVLMENTEQTTFTIEQVAGILNVHKDTVRRAIKAGRLKGAKLGKEYRISKKDLEAFYRSHGGGELFPEQ